MNSNTLNHPAGLLQRLLHGGLLLILVNAPTARADSWQRLADLPGRRAAHSAVWTGNEMIVWGGGVDGQFLNTGARYTPATDTWHVTSHSGAPSPRWFHAAVWTGSEMIVFGGRPDFFSNGNFNDGARYDPKTDTWTPISNVGAPTPRSQCAAVWSGSEMIIWGGETEASVPLGDGAAYNPATDSWRPISDASGLAPRTEPTAVWTGSEMIVFGGVDGTKPGWLSYGDGARYNPFTDTWAPLPADGAPGSRTGHTAVWTGERMIVWGGRLLPADLRLNDGAIYNPGSDTWTGLSPSGAPEPRQLHAAVWTGTEMIIWGGETPAMLDTGARYHPATGVWTPTTQENAPGKRMFWRPDLGIWTGRGMLICAGSDYPASLESTAIYYPVPSVQPPVPTDILIRFDPPSLPGGSRLIEAWNESGFNFVTATGRMAHTDSRVSTNRPGNGTAYLQFLFGQKPLIISSLTGQAFALKRVDLAEYSTVFPVLKTVTFTGYHPDGSSIAQSFTTDGIIDGGGPLADFETFTFPASFADLVRVEVTPDVYSLDNLLVSVATNAPPPPPPPPPSEGAYDLSRDFSLTGNPNGPWSYGYLTALNEGSFGLLRASRTFSADNGVPIAAWELETYQLPGVWKVLGPEVAHSDGDNFTAEAGTVYFAPGADGAPQNFGAIRFTVPADRSGQYRIGTSVRSLFDHDRSRDADFHVLRNGRQIFSQFLAPNSATSYSNVLTLAAGDRIDFAIGRGADGLTADTGLKIQASLTLLTPPPVPPPVRGTYDLRRDYSTNANPNGVWSFGWKSVLNGRFTLFTFHDSILDQGALIDYWLMNEQGPSSVYHNAGNVTLINNDGQGVYPPGTVWFGPGYDENPDNFSVIRFTVPPNGAGTYQLDTAVLPALDGPISGDTDFHVLKNGSPLFEEFLPPNTGTSYSNVAVLAAGDTIEFACGRGRDGLTYASGLKIEARLRLLTAVTNPPPLRFYDVSRGFSPGHNPNGAWSYGYQTTLGGAFTLLTFPLTSFGDNPVPVDSWSKNGYEPVAVYHNGATNTSISDGGAGVFPPGTTWFYPGVEGNTDNYGVIRFTVPTGGSGIYQLQTEVQAYLDGPRSGDTDFHVLKNGGELFGEFIPGNSGAGYSNRLSLVEGDTIDFAVGRGQDNVAFDSGLKIRASLALIAARPLPPPRIYDLSSDYSLAANPNGAWSYGHVTGALNGTFGLVTTARTFGAENGVPIAIWQQIPPGKPWVAKVLGPDTAVSYLFNGPAGTVYFGPDPDAVPEDFGVIRFTTPSDAAGRYRLETAVRTLYDGPRSADADFHVLKNGQELFGQFLAPNSGTNYSNVLALAAGDTVDFVAGRGVNALADTGLKIQATLTGIAENPMSIDRILSVTDGACRVIGHAPPGTICHIERSKNLFDWEDAGFAVTTNEGVFEFIDLQSPPGPVCFYRLQETQP